MTIATQDELAESVSDAPVAMESAWITDDLIARTRNVWSSHLQRRVSRSEAVEMLINVQNLAMAFHMASTESESSDERSDLGTGITED